MSIYTRANQGPLSSKHIMTSNSDCGAAVVVRLKQFILRTQRAAATVVCSVEVSTLDDISIRGIAIRYLTSLYVQCSVYRLQTHSVRTV